MIANKVTVLVVNGCFPPPYGGIGKWLSGVLPYLTNEGYCFHVLMQGGGEYQHFEKDGLKTYSLSKPNKAQWIFFNIFYFIMFFPSIWRRVVRHKLPFLEAMDTLTYWGPGIEKILINNPSIDAIHFHDTPWSQGWVCSIFAQKYKKKLLGTTYGEVVPHRDPILLIDSESYKYKSFCKDVIDKCYRIASITKYCCSNLSFLEVNPRNVFLTYPVFGLEEFKKKIDKSIINQVKSSYGIQDASKIILFVGQLQPRKGGEVLAKALTPLLKDRPSVKAVFIGPDMGSGKEIQEIFKKAGVEKQLVLTGPVEKSVLLAFYELALAFVFPTVSKIECLGLSFVQAGAKRKAVVASNISGVPEVIEDGKEGLLFPPGDETKLKMILREILEGEIDLDYLGNNLYERIELIFNEEEITRQLKKFYDFK
jgi:glycosyltransferase involved in cell wall biosynthesis